MTNLYPEATIRSHNLHSRSTLNSLLKSVAPPQAPNSARTSSIARDLTSNQLFQHQRRLSAEQDPDLDLAMLSKILDAEDDYGFKSSRFSSQVILVEFQGA